MTTPTAKAKLITIICGMELEARLAVGLKELGCVSGYTLVHAKGRGMHGPRAVGPVDGGNVRIEIITAPAHEQAIMDLLVRSFDSDALTAFVQDVQAFPARHFT
jgi:hypothetical protein